MIELSAKLTTGTVYLAGEALECRISFCHTTQPEHRNSQSHSDILENLAWASAQIHCFFSTSKNFVDKNTVVEKTTALEVTSCDIGDVVFHTKPKILFCDLTIPLGETKTFWYRESLPIEAPPSYRGTAVKYSYKITIATQKVGSHIKMVRIPFRVLPISPIMNLQDLAALCGNETTEELQPTNPFSEERKVETPLTMALQVLQNLTARRSPNSYMITNARGKVGRFCLFKSAYRLGEDIVGTFDFSVGTVTCMQVSVSLQPEEVTKTKSPSRNINKENSSRSMTVARYHEVTLGLTHSQLILPIPLHITPAFEIDGVSLSWRLHFEFVTSQEKLLPNPEDKDWNAPLNVPIETMVWNLPVKIYSTLPKQITQQHYGNDNYRGDDRRVMLWQFGQAILNYGKPEPMKALHLSNIFCLGITSDNQKIYSGGNDDRVIVHDLESKRPLEVLQHQRAVSSLSIDPFNERVVATAGNDGRLLLFDTRQSVHESLVVSRSREAFHGVMFHPLQVSMLVSANDRDGVALWDLRSPKHPVIRYVGNKGSGQNSMSVCFNQTGTHILALRRRLPPVLYTAHSPEPVAEFYHQDYYNSCTMKSCCFAGKNDQFVLSGSDDFNLYMWKIPDTGGGFNNIVVEPPHVVLYGHRSIVNQVRYNSHYCLIASSGVEKIIKVWSALEYPHMRGTLLEEAQGSDNPREIYSHEDYVSLVHHSGQYLSHNYAEQSTSEDPRMMAFFDSLLQRELECLAEETDSLDGSSSGSLRNNDSDSSNSDQIAVDFPSLPPKRSSKGSRSQRCPNRLARLVASRYPKSVRSQKRGALRRNKQSRPCTSKSSSVKVSRPTRRARGRRQQHARRLSPSSERSDSDETPHCLYRSTGRILRPLRRRINTTRSNKRKNKGTSYRKLMNLRSNSNGIAQDSSDNNNFSNIDNFEDNLALPSTSTGYRGQNNTLFRIAEVDSDDDQSVGSRSVSHRSQQGNSPNLVNIVPTPINGSLGDSFRVEHVESESNNSSPPPENRLRMNLRRVRRNGRLSQQLSDSSESPPPKNSERLLAERLSPKGFNRTVARLMNETNESELESSCSTEGSLWPAPNATPDSGVGTVAGSSTRNPLPADDVSDDPEFIAHKFRQKVKKARRNYRTHMDSDSN